MKLYITIHIIKHLAQYLHEIKLIEYFIIQYTVF